MSAELHDRYARLIRWYPSEWRRRHGESAIAALMDQADDEGRDRPTAQEAREFARAGLAARLRASATDALLPLTGATFAVLWMMAEAGRSYSGSSPWLVAAIALLLGGAIAVARSWPAVAMGIVGALLVAQVLYGPLRFANTSWPMWLALLVVIGFAAASSSRATRLGALLLAAVGGLTVGMLVLLPLPAVGTPVAAPFAGVLSGTFDGEPIDPLQGGAVIVGTAVVVSLVAWGLGRLASHRDRPRAV